MPAITKSPSSNRKRKLDDDPAIEIDLSAPEPPSKKALRKAKKKLGDEADAAAPVESHDEGQKGHAKRPAQRPQFGVWIGNLPFSATKDDIRSFLTTRCSFSEGEITRIHLPTRNGVHQNKGFAYVDLSSRDATQQAIGLSEQLLNGRPVLIKDAMDFAGRPDKSAHQTDHNDAPSSEGAASGSKNPPSRKVFVGNLAFDVTKERLEEHFRRCGPVSVVRMATFEDSGKCKGYAWVEFEALDSAEAAVRGSMKVPDEDASEDSDDGGNSDGQQQRKEKKQKLKKIWVNRLMGRTLRTEFAEDPATRYQKRFGKEAQGRATTETSDSKPDIKKGSERNASSVRPSTAGSKPRDKAKPDTRTHGRYSEDTVNRLSGSIVASQGKRTTFD